jgi:hypothetical protein
VAINPTSIYLPHTLFHTSSPISCAVVRYTPIPCAVVPFIPRPPNLIPITLLTPPLHTFVYRNDKRLSLLEILTLDSHI